MASIASITSCRLGYFDDTRFFRVLNGFMAQFGVQRRPERERRVGAAALEDDPVKQTNKRGR